MPELRDKHARPSFEERWRKRFIKFADNEDDAGIAGWSVTGLDARFRHFTKVWSGDVQGAVWLDVGCGAGTYTRYLADQGVSVIGMDYSHPTVLKARDRAPRHIPWAVGDVTRLPVGDEALDGVLCFGVFQALERAEPAVEELVRVVKPGGQIWIDALNSWCLASILERFVRWVKGRPRHLRYESPRSLRRIMAAMGCTNVRSYWVLVLPESMQGYRSYLDTPVARRVFRYFPFVHALLSHAFVLQVERPGGSGDTGR